MECSALGWVCEAVSGVDVAGIWADAVSAFTVFGVSVLLAEEAKFSGSGFFGTSSCLGNFVSSKSNLQIDIELGGAARPQMAIRLSSSGTTW